MKKTRKNGKEEIKNESSIKPGEGVLTQSELEKEGSKKAPDSIKESEKQKPLDLKEVMKNEMVFECPYAPLGKSNIAFEYEKDGVKKHYQLELDNKQYKIPADLSNEEKEDYRIMLRANGFVDVTIINSGAVIDKVKKSYIYKVVHPEHTHRNTINGSISLVLLDDNNQPMLDKNGKQITKQLNIEYGICETDDVKVYEALLKAGFYSAGQVEKE